MTMRTVRLDEDTEKILQTLTAETGLYSFDILS